MKAKLISENLHNFEKKSNSLSSLGIGKRALIEKWLDEMSVSDYTINEDFTIDVEGTVDLFEMKIVKFPEYIQFNIVKGYMSCAHCELITLKGCPIKVYQDFYCDWNNLTSLEGCPKLIGGSLYCGHNKVKFKKEDIEKNYKIYCKIFC